MAENDGGPLVPVSADLEGRASGLVPGYAGRDAIVCFLENTLREKRVVDHRHALEISGCILCQRACDGLVGLSNHDRTLNACCRTHPARQDSGMP